MSKKFPDYIDRLSEVINDLPDTDKNKYLFRSLLSLIIKQNDLIKRREKILDILEKGLTEEEEEKELADL